MLSRHHYIAIFFGCCCLIFSRYFSKKNFWMSIMSISRPWMYAWSMFDVMSSGVPVIVSPVGMNAEVLELGEVGFAASTHAEWIEGLEALAADGSAARRMGRQGRRVIDERFSVRVVAHQIADAFAGLVDRS